MSLMRGRMIVSWASVMSCSKQEDNCLWARNHLLSCNNLWVVFFGQGRGKWRGLLILLWYRTIHYVRWFFHTRLGGGAKCHGSSQNKVFIWSEQTKARGGEKDFVCLLWINKTRTEVTLKKSKSILSFFLSEMQGTCLQESERFSVTCFTSTKVFSLRPLLVESREYRAFCFLTYTHDTEWGEN